MKATRNIVILNWDADKGVMPDPDPVFLSPDDTVTFRAGTLPPFAANGSIRVSFEPQTCLSRGTFEPGDNKGDIEVIATLPQKLHYSCDLLVDGVPTPQPDSPSGGTGMPAGGGGGGSHTG